MKELKVFAAAVASRLDFAEVESGEGIERTEDARGRLRGGHWWNPVKELKAPNIRRVRPSDPHSGIR